MSKKIVIIGGGVIGLCTAWYATQQGHQVTILERYGPDHAGCSLGNAGMIVPSHFIPLAAPGMVGMGLRMLPNPESPFAIRPSLSPALLRWGWHFIRAANAERVAQAAPLLRDMNLASRACYEEFAAQFDHRFQLVQRGLLMLCKSEQTLQEEAHVAEKAHELGLPAEVLKPEEAAQLDPAIQMEIAGAVYFPQDCHLNPPLFLAELTQALQAAGVGFQWETEVTGWRRGKGQIEAVRTSRGEFTADEYVIAGGAWSSAIAASLGLRLPMQAGKGYSMTLMQPKQLPQLCSILTEARVAVTPMGTSLRFAGTMEITGTNLCINLRRVQGIVKSIPTYFPAFSREDFSATPIWSGLRPCSPDGLPYIGRFQRYTNLSVATGHAMMGLSLGPITGRLMSEILSHQPPSLPLDLLSPERYA